MSRRQVGAARIAAIVSLCAVLWACGWGGSDADGSDGSKGSKPKVAASSKQRTMVAAVSGSRTPGAVDLRFVLSGRPEVGQPVDIQFAITPLQDLETLFIRFIAADGVEVAKGAETRHLEHPPVGVTIDHTVSVIPKTDGIYYLTAVVVSDSPTESVTRNYSIPIIAGEGVPEAPAAAATGPESASRQP